MTLRWRALTYAAQSRGTSSPKFGRRRREVRRNMTSEEKQNWEAMELTPAGDVGEVLQVSTGGGKSPNPVNPDQGMEIPTSPPGQE